MTALAAQRYVGSPVRRSEDDRILTGHGRFVDDVVLPGMLHAAFVRAAIAHGRIRSVDATAARQADGVVAVLTGEELQKLIVPGPFDMAAAVGVPGPAFTMLCTSKVRMVGDPIAVVVAESRYQAEDACELVDVDIDELPAVASAGAAFDPGSPPVFEELGGNVILHTPPHVYGDLEGAFSRADRTVTARFQVHRHQNVPMEGRVIAVDFDQASGKLTVYSATQSVHFVRHIMAARLGLPREQVHVVAGDIGGSFGLKMGGSREEVAVAAAARHLGRPVKWVEDRNEHLASAGQAREESVDVEAAVTGQGAILGLKVNMVFDQGAYPGLAPQLADTLEGVLPGPYKIEGYSFEKALAVTNKASYVAYRGPWASETFARERMIDLIARELGMDPLQVRLRNVVTRGKPPLAMVTRLSLAGITARETMERIAEVVDFAGFRRRQEAARAEGRLLGLGVATYIEGAPIPGIDDAAPGLGGDSVEESAGPARDNKDGAPGPGGDDEIPPGASFASVALAKERTRVRLDPDGTVVVYIAQTPHGQSHQTTCAQVAADQMGVPIEQVRVEYGDTDTAPVGFTGGSRAARMAGGATMMAARELRTRVLDLAADLLEVRAADLQITDGKVSVKGDPDAAITVADVAGAVEAGRFASGTGTSLEVYATFDRAWGGWAAGTHCAEVEVDPGTGAVKILRYVVAEDCGEVINPAIVEGQIRGGVAQGIGAVLLERSVYDDDGQFLTGSFMDYLLPTATEIPRIEVEHVQPVRLDPEVNFRGIGEGGMIVAPPTLCNAIEDALAPHGVRIHEQHLPPARILELIGTIQPEASSNTG